MNKAATAAFVCCFAVGDIDIHNLEFGDLLPCLLYQFFFIFYGIRKAETLPGLTVIVQDIQKFEFEAFWGLQFFCNGL